MKLDVPTYATFLTVELAFVHIIIEVTDSTEIVETKLQATATTIVCNLDNSRQLT